MNKLLVGVLLGASILFGVGWCHDHRGLAAVKTHADSLIADSAAFANWADQRKHREDSLAQVAARQKESIARERKQHADSVATLNALLGSIDSTAAHDTTAAETDHEKVIVFRNLWQQQREATGRIMAEMQRHDSTAEARHANLEETRVADLAARDTTEAILRERISDLTNTLHKLRKGAKWACVVGPTAYIKGLNIGVTCGRTIL